MKVADGQEAAKVRFSDDGYLEYCDFVASEASGCRVTLLLAKYSQDTWYADVMLQASRLLSLTTTQ
jgi:hypothetical protein